MKKNCGGGAARRKKCGGSAVATASIYVGGLKHLLKQVRINLWGILQHFVYYIVSKWATYINMLKCYERR